MHLQWHKWEFRHWALKAATFLRHGITDNFSKVPLQDPNSKKSLNFSHHEHVEEHACCKLEKKKGILQQSFTLEKIDWIKIWVLALNTFYFETSFIRLASTGELGRGWSSSKEHRWSVTKKVRKSGVKKMCEKSAKGCSNIVLWVT